MNLQWKGSENCYKFDFERNGDGNSVDRISWAEARASCNSHGAELVSLHKSNDEEKMTELISSKSKNTEFWIGLYNRGYYYGYGWSDFTALNYVNWGKNEPNNHNGQENCVMMIINEDSGYLQFSRISGFWIY